MKVLAIALALSMDSAWLAAGDVGDDGWEAVKKTAKSFTLTDLEGRKIRSADLSGKVVVVDFWATWCGPCLQELPDLVKFHEGLKGKSDVAFLSFNVTEPKEDVIDFVKKQKVPFPVYLADDLLGPYEVFAFPTKLIIDLRGAGKGVVRYRRIGYTPLDSLQAKVREVLSHPVSSHLER